MNAYVRNTRNAARRVATVCLALVLVGLLPGHGGNSGGVVVLPHAVASAQPERELLQQNRFAPRQDLQLRVPSELAGCSIELTADGQNLSSKASLDGCLLTIPYADLADLASVAITETRFVLAAENGDTLILEIQFDAATMAVSMDVR